MNVFMLGRVIEPEIVTTTKGSVLKLAVLSGRQSTEFSIFEIASVDEKTGEITKNPVFGRASKLKDGDYVGCIVNPAVNSKGSSVAFYLRDIAPIDTAVGETLKKAFNPLEIRK